MNEPNLCRACGNPRPADAPAGLCPICMLRAGWADGTATGARQDHDVTVSLAPASSSVLADVAATLGGLPRILLRDTDLSEEPSPLVQPGSSEMPTPAERPERYQLFGEIAHGGMGAVLRGRDSDIGRDLAVKVLLESHKDKPDLVRRFIEEAQIGGQLQHPGVVPIYDIGAFSDRRPFFTMKLVKGRTLAALLGERGRVSASSSSLRTTPRADATGLASSGASGPAADLPRFLSIFEQVCQTMAYAHTRGVIHRDLKPSNIMVGSFGEVQVMDWGLAKVLPRGGVVDDASPGKEHDHETVVATDRTGSGTELSQAGSVLGTPAYMAPEQARGEIDRLDERADVFALGSILCEILTGEPAFTGRSSSEILRKSGRGHLGPAVVRLDSCDAERELIVLAKKCLAPERDDRPQSARVVAEAMTVYLAGVQERLRAAELARVEADARAAFERKRRRLALALAASIIGTILVGGGGWVWNERQRQERQRERQERTQRVELALREVQLLQGQADRAGDDRDRWIAAVDAARALERLAGDADGPTGRTITELVKMVTDGADAAERDRKLLDGIIGMHSGGDDDPDGAVGDARFTHAFREARFDVDILGAEAAAARIGSRPPEMVQNLARALDTWAAMRRLARPQDVDSWKRLLAAARSADPDPIRNRLRDLWSEPDPKARRGELLELARQARGPNWAPRSLALLILALEQAGERDAVLEVLRRAQLEHPKDYTVNVNLGNYLRAAHPPQLDEAIRFLSVARVLRPESGHELAHLLEDRGRLDEAQAIFEELTRLRPSYGRHWGCLAGLLRQRGSKAANAALEKAVAVCRAQLRLDPAFPHAHCNLAHALTQQGKLAEAIAEYREGIRVKPDDSSAHNSLGALLCDAAHDYEGAAAEFRTAIRLQPDCAASAHANLSVALRMQGKVAGEIAELREAIRLDPDVRRPHNDLGAILCDVVHDYDAAAAEFRTAIRLEPDDIAANGNLGESLWCQGKFAEAQKALRRARDLARGQPQRITAIEGNLAQIERQSALATRLPALLRRDDKPKDADEAAEFAELAFRMSHYAASARFNVEAFRTKPALAQDLKAARRYTAARAAAMAGAGKGQDQPPPDERERGKWRQQALDWLEADLALYTRELAPGSRRVNAQVRRTLEGWKLDRELAGIRDDAAVMTLPEPERKACRALWAEVDKVLKACDPGSL
jgi:serine/threonine-protein kinase